jgi:hypothetical protein
MIRARAFLTVLSTAAAMALVVAAPAHAALTLTAPKQNGAIGGTQSTLPVSWVAECPAGKECGAFGNGTVYPGVSIETKHATFTNASDVQGDTWASGVPPTAGTYGLYVGSSVTGGGWVLTVSWQECTAAVAPAKVDGATCETVTVTRNLKAAVQFGTKEYPAYAYALKASRPKGRLQGSLSMGCNGPKAMYRANLEVLKRVKVRGKYRWVSAVRRNNLAPINAGTHCDWMAVTAFPGGITNTTQLRTRYTVRAVGVGTAQKKVVQSKVYTRASLGGGGGGVVIGT